MVQNATRDVVFRSHKGLPPDRVHDACSDPYVVGVLDIANPRLVHGLRDNHASALNTPTLNTPSAISLKRGEGPTSAMAPNAVHNP